MRVYATGFSPRAKPLGSFDLTRPTAIIMGNEHSGVDPELLAIADAELYIPMYGMIQSFNVSVAAAIILAEASRQRLASGAYDTPTYTEDELEQLTAEWLQL